ncbi:MAG: nicotinamide riboside transporter PnuC [Psittacicella sp.]
MANTNSTESNSINNNQDSNSSKNAKHLTNWHLFSPFQKFFLVFFFIASIITFLSPMVLGQGFISIFSLGNILGLLVTLTGIYVSIYQARAEVSIYYFWFINTIAYAIQSLLNGWYGQFGEAMIISLPLLIYGWINWYRHIVKEDTKEVLITKFTIKEWIGFSAVMIILCLAYGEILLNLTSISQYLFGITFASDPQPFIDSFMTILTLAAMYTTAKRYMESWYFWIFMDLLGFFTFGSHIIDTSKYSLGVIVGDVNGVLGDAQFAISGFYGYWLWTKLMKEQKESLKLQKSSKNSK